MCGMSAAFWARRLPERKAVGAGAIAQAIGISILLIPAHVHAVVALDPTEVLGPVIGLIRSSSNGIALHSANVSSEPVHVDVGSPEVCGIERSGIHTQTLRINLVVHFDDLR